MLDEASAKLMTRVGRQRLTRNLFTTSGPAASGRPCGLSATPPVKMRLLRFEIIE